MGLLDGVLTLWDHLSRFVDDALGFALTWNYWFNDAVSTASDLVSLHLLLIYWTDIFPGWAISLIFLFVLLGLNIVSVRAYGEVRSYFLFFLPILTDVHVDGVLAEFAQSHHHRGRWNLTWMLA